MSAPTREEIMSCLAQVTDPDLGQDLVAAGAVADVQVADGRVAVKLRLGHPARSVHAELVQAVQAAIASRHAGLDVTVDIATDVAAHAVQRGVRRMGGVKNIVAIASGKGGVGKSTTAVNLALALQAEGAKAGILDADIYGPSQPRMLGCRTKPDSDGKSLQPNVVYGLQSMSIGYLIDEETPMIWRGPMVTSALEQLLTQTAWQDLDYLVVDLPPGTGDIQLTLCQKIPVSGAIIVTTPQDIALLDARKALKMFEKVEVPVLGIVENMSTHICSKCGHEEHIFGSGGGLRMAKQYGVDLLGELPLDIRIREGVDNGRPTVALEPDSPISAAYRAIARRAAAKLSQRAKDYSGAFPKIVVENS